MRQKLRRQTKFRPYRIFGRHSDEAFGRKKTTSRPKVVWQHADSFHHHVPKAWLLICFGSEVATR
jgi:hypothetical protein